MKATLGYNIGHAIVLPVSELTSIVRISNC